MSYGAQHSIGVVAILPDILCHVDGHARMDGQGHGTQRSGTFQAATVAALWLARSQWHSPADALDAVSAAVVSFEFVIRDIISGSAPDSFPDYFGCCLAF